MARGGVIPEENEHGDEEEHNEPGMVPERVSGQPDGDEDRTDAGRCTQEAEPPRAEFEDVAPDTVEKIKRL